VASGAHISSSDVSIGRAPRDRLRVAIRQILPRRAKHDAEAVVRRHLAVRQTAGWWVHHAIAEELQQRLVSAVPAGTSVSSSPPPPSPGGLLLRRCLLGRLSDSAFSGPAFSGGRFVRACSRVSAWGSDAAPAASPRPRPAVRSESRDCGEVGRRGGRRRVLMAGRIAPARGSAWCG